MTAPHLREILQKAVLAPSSDNMQPWKFKQSADAVEVWLDPARSSHLSDANGMSPLLSAGAVIENMRVAASRFGLQAAVDYFPDGGKTDWVARVRFSGAGKEKHPHEGVLDRRLTNRKFYSGKPLPPSFYEDVRSLLKGEDDFGLVWVDNADHRFPKLGRMIGEADRFRFQNRRLHGEFFEVLKFKGQETDGLPVGTLEAGPGSSYLFRTMSSWGRMRLMNGAGFSRSFDFYARMQMKSSAAAGILMTRASSAWHFVRGGELMERIWHEAAAQNVALQPMQGLPIFFQIVHSPGAQSVDAWHRDRIFAIQAEFKEAFGEKPFDIPLFLFRVGRAPEVKTRAGRRPLEEFLCQ